MSEVTMGLIKKQSAIVTLTKEITCISCNGTGEKVHGKVNTNRLGLTELFTDCYPCEGVGKTKVSYRKLPKKSSVQVLC